MRCSVDMPRGQLRDILFSGHHHRASFSSHALQSLGHGLDLEMDATFMWKLSKMGRIGSSRLRFDDDFSDRLNYQFSGVILFLFIGLIGIRQYVGKPIQCFIPQEFTRGWEEYAENYCWVANTYFAPISGERLPPAKERREKMIQYYQWAPIVLAVQALMFYIPCLVWRLFMSYSGFNVRKILQMACDSNILMPDALSKNVRFTARYMESCIYRQREYRKGMGVRVRHCLAKCTCICCGKRYGNYLVVLYFFVKVLYLLNIFGQIYMMERFIGTNYTFYGVSVLHDLSMGKEWDQSGHFPRVTFCDFESVKLGKNLAYTLQCVLPLNMFLEKIYIFLWFWHLLVGLITLFSFVTWFLRMGFSRKRLSFVRKYLKIMNAIKDTDKTTTRKFVENYLRPDGVFIVRLIAINCGDIIAGDLICELWNIYRHKRLQDLDDGKLDDARGLPGFILNNNNNNNNSSNGNNDRNNDDSIV